MATDIIRLLFLVSIFGSWPLLWQHYILITGRYILIFDLNFLIFILFFGKFFFILCHIMEMILPDIFEVVKSQGRYDGFANIL